MRKNIRSNEKRYSNAYLISGSIPLEYVKGIQVRLLKLIDMIDASSNSITMNKFIEYYNDLIDCVSYMVENKIDIPLPSQPDQDRIVSILDRFDALCNDISTGLPAEIEARQKQYEYYRDKLLTFKERS